MYKGWPLVLDAKALLAQGDQASLGLKGSPWTAALTLRIDNASGAQQVRPVELMWSAKEPIVLEPLSEAAVFWVVAPERASALAEGDYTISLTLDTRKAPQDGAWSGACRARQVSLKVAAEPARLGADEERLKALVRARYYELRGDRATALSVIQERLARTPDDPVVLAEQAGLLERSGNVQEAIAALDRAIAAYYKQNPDADEPPTEMIRNLSRLIDATMPAEK